ncbi:Brp/Blh family beta-carotene 15,15'-dioxygenase [Amylibacter sp.]|jgi:beta-carotene 15,15'-dioxygenase|nr:Brp/Blh family beta-carotene 15,15'-dioxygenase [Amylibacter sp.]
MIETMVEVLSTQSIHLELTSLIALAMIVVFGLPHGAFDGAVAMALGFGETLHAMLGFVSCYIAIAILVVLFWLMLPEIALIIFLLVSSLHFGMGDSQSVGIIARTTQIFAHGGLAVIGISLFHKDEVDEIFSHLTGNETVLVWHYLDIAGFFLFAVIAAYFVQALFKPMLRRRLLELILLCFAYYLLPPLIGFTLYFCGVHSVRHIRYTWGRLRSKEYEIRTIIFLAAGFTIASWFFGMLMFWQVPKSEFLDAAILRTIFIGLAALTVPHMLLVDGIFRRSK